MTLTPEADARIDDRIRRLAPWRSSSAGHAELRTHVADAAEGLAGGRKATPSDVDAAFAALGSERDIRATFFPTRARLPVSRWQVALLALATALAATAIASDDGGTATCSVQGPGTCEVSSRGAALDLLVWAGPPLVVLACLFLFPSWAGVAIAGLYGIIVLVRTIDLASIEGPSWLDLLLMAAGILAVGVAARHLQSERRARASAI